jgi:branched-chain amino acid transport system permease protein
MSAAPPSPTVTPSVFLKRRAGWKPWEFVVWVLALVALYLFPERASLMNEIAILALFALSLDLILGYAGIASLGHAAFFGVAAYVAGLFAKHVYPEPVTGLVVAMLATGVLGFLTSFLVVRGSDLTRLMVTLGVSLMAFELANRLDGITGGADGLLGVTIGPILGRFEFDFFGTTAYLYSLTVLFLLFLLSRRIVNSPFGLSLKAVKHNRLRASAIGISPTKRIVAIYTLSAIYAGAAGALLAQTTAFVSLEVLDFQRSADGLLVLVIGGAGYLYGGLFGAVAFKLMKDVLSGLTPAYWLFWMGAILVVLVLVGRDRLAGRFRALLTGHGRSFRR